MQGRATNHNLFQAMVAQGSSPAILAMPAFLPVMPGTVLGRGSQERKARQRTLRMEIIFKTAIFALLLSFCLGDEQKEKEVVEKDDQLLRFTIPLGFKAGQLLEEDDPALR